MHSCQRLSRAFSSRLLAAKQRAGLRDHAIGMRKEAHENPAKRGYRMATALLAALSYNISFS